MPYQLYWGVGESLRPFVSPHSLISLESSERPLSIGDLVVYVERHALICHRILFKKKEEGLNWYFLKGDWNFDPDGWIPEYRLVGKVEKINEISLSRLNHRLKTYLAVGFSYLKLLFRSLFFDSQQRRRTRMLDLQGIRKVAGQFVFTHLIHPPDAPSPALRDFNGDYGHGFFYEEFFAGDGEDLKAAEMLVERNPGPILDLAGGAGRLSERLCQRGYDVTLVDCSSTMLERAVSKRDRLTPEQKTSFQIFPQEMSQLKLDKKFRYVFSLNNGLEHLPSEEKIVETLERVADHLTPNGDFYLDVHFPLYLEKGAHWKAAEWVYTQDVRVEGTRYRVWSRTLPGAVSEQAICDHAISDDLNTFQLLRTPLYLLNVEKWKSLFRRGGFTVEGQWGSWRWEPISPHLPKLVFHLKKIPG